MNGWRKYSLQLTLGHLKISKNHLKISWKYWMQDTSFEERLKLLKWPTLEQRRSFLSLIECYKTINSPNGLDTLRLCFRFAHDFGPLGADHRFKLKCIHNFKHLSF